MTGKHAAVYDTTRLSDLEIAGVNDVMMALRKLCFQSQVGDVIIAHADIALEGRGDKRIGRIEFDASTTGLTLVVEEPIAAAGDAWA